jgi:hypothetical protein
MGTRRAVPVMTGQPIFRNASPSHSFEFGAGVTFRGKRADGGSNFGKDQPMRLNETQLKQTLNQMDAEVLPETHPAAAQLIDLFGDHTFFLDQSGLKVLEPAETSASDVQTSQVVSLADWSDATLTSLKPHAPEPTGRVVVFEQMKH